MMPKTLVYRTADDLHVVDDAGALVLVGFVVRYEGSPFASGAFARSSRERAHKVTAARHQNDRLRVPVGRPVTVEDRPDGLWVAFELSEAVTDEEAGAARLAYRVVRTDDRGVVTEAAVDHVAIGIDPSRDRTARLNRLLTLTRDSARIPRRSNVPCLKPSSPTTPPPWPTSTASARSTPPRHSTSSPAATPR